MKNCPNCKAEVLESYEICWNCQYSFTEFRVISQTEFTDKCPNCNTEIESIAERCPNCQFELKTEVQINEEDNIHCLRCKVPMEYMGSRIFQEGSKFGVMNDLVDLFSSHDSFNLYACPKCGKIEFFLPLKED